MAVNDPAPPRPQPVRRRGVGPFSLRQVTIAILAMMGAAIVGTLATRPLGSIPIGLPVPDPSAYLIGSPIPGLRVGDLAPELDERTRAVLDFERSWWLEGGPKERLIRERFGISSTRYQQRLMRAIDLPEALRYDPMLVRRLRRLRESRRRKRLARRLGLPQ